MRVYGRVINVYVTNEGWKNRKELPYLLTAAERATIEMYELEYTDYREDGTVCGMGTEDFSPERMRTLHRQRTFQVKRDSGERTATGRIRWICRGEYVRVKTMAKDYEKAVKMFKRKYEKEGWKLFII